MKTSLPLLLLCSSLLPIPVLAQKATSFPPGARAANDAQTEFEREMPPPQANGGRNPAQLQREVDELVGLAQSLPEQIRQLDRGMLPKDLLEKLKRIEKLSKKMRTELQ